jgi:hypothetical protein
MSSVVVAGDTSGSVTLQAPAVSGSTVITLPTTSGTMATLTTPSFTTTIGVGNATPSTSGAGITFPATQSASTNANTLDDYEEGTWTPSFDGSGSITFNAQTGTYTKVGRLVTAVFHIDVASASRNGVTVILGLPFNGANTNYAGASFSSFETGAFNGYCNMQGLTGAASNIQLRGTTSATVAPHTISISISVATVIAGSITYFTS